MIAVATLNKPCSSKERADFIVKYNHQSGLQIEETETEIKAMDFSEEEKANRQEIQDNIDTIKAQEERLASIKDDINTAFALDNQEWLAELKAEYQSLVYGEVSNGAE